MTSLTGRVVLVSGGARGIGGATVRRLAAEGAKVVIADIRDEQGHRLASDMGESVEYHHLDVGSEQDWARVVDATVGRFGKLDGLANVAGVFEWIPLRDYPLTNFMEVVRVNQVGVFLGMRAVIPAMEAAGGGTIVNVSSGAGLTGIAFAIAYTASKFAVTGMTKTAALELRPLNIRVNSVHPGGVRTPLTMGDAFEESGGTMDGVSIDSRNRWGEPEEIANLIWFLTSEESSFCTGAQFVADDGATSGVLPAMG
jgi:3alpha(or 20beta)-hydroxysteroid dehydrogenase